MTLTVGTVYDRALFVKEGFVTAANSVAFSKSKSQSELQPTCVGAVRWSGIIVGLKISGSPCKKNRLCERCCGCGDGGIVNCRIEAVVIRAVEDVEAFHEEFHPHLLRDADISSDAQI